MIESVGVHFIMAGEADKLWAKLDQIQETQQATLLNVEKVAGDQRVAHAQFNGKLEVMGKTIEEMDRRHAHDRGNTAQKFDAINKRIDANDSDIDELRSIKQYNAGRERVIAIAVSAVISFIVGLAVVLVKTAAGG